MQQNTPNTGRPSIQEFVQDLKRNKKKTALLAALAIVCLVVVGRLFIKPSLPESASAVVTAAANVSHEATKAESAPSGGSDDDQRRLKYIHQIDPKITRDLFAMKDELFPRSEPVTPAPVVIHPATRPAAPDQASIERDIRNEANKLFAKGLQSTVSGPNPTAIINERVLRNGDRIEGFEIVDITSRSCSLVKKGVRITLALTRQE